MEKLKKLKVKKKKKITPDESSLRKTIKNGGVEKEFRNTIKSFRNTHSL